MRLPLVVVVLTTSFAGCWTDDALVDGTFTPAQFAALEDRFRMPANVGPGPASDVAALGQQLFFDPALSTDMAGHLGTTSCATCHDVKTAFIDPRVGSNVSQGTTWTKRNAMTILNTSLKLQLADRPTHLFTWNGKYDSPGQILDLAVKGPFCSARRVVATVVRTSYGLQYAKAFGHAPAAGCTSPVDSAVIPTGCVGASDTTCAGDDLVFRDAIAALDAYIAQIVTLHAPFDAYIAGDDGAISDEAKRGFGVFVGRGTCIECHDGPLFTKYEFLDTGVPQTGAHVPDTDPGVAQWTMKPEDTGKFMTASLRDVALTPPYMHDGALPRLADVIDFYRGGGVATGYTGTKDPRMVPLDLTDEDAHDLEAFLHTLTDTDPIPAPLLADTHVPACTWTPMPGGPSYVGRLCNGTCVMGACP